VASHTPPAIAGGSRPGLHTLGSCCDPNDQDLLPEEVPAATFGASSGSPEI